MPLLSWQTDALQFLCYRLLTSPFFSVTPVLMLSTVFPVSVSSPSEHSEIPAVVAASGASIDQEEPACFRYHTSVSMAVRARL